MRKRSPRVVWLPPTNANSLGAVDNVYQTFFVEIDGVAGDFAVGEIPLVIDGEADPLSQGNTLSDIENSGYRLRRIVGKVWCRVLQVTGDTPFRSITTAGIIVRRTNEVTGASYAVETTNGELVSPSQIRNSGDPWIWRRSWMMGNNQSGNQGANDGLLPEDNFFGVTALDGPHVDQKTARIIGPEERLFLDVSVTNADGAAVSTVNTQIQVYTDLRVLGSMRTSSGNRKNASR